MTAELCGRNYIGKQGYPTNFAGIVGLFWRQCGDLSLLWPGGLTPRPETRELIFGRPLRQSSEQGDDRSLHFK